MQVPDSFSIRPATVDDVPLILSLIRELADYEKLLHADCRHRRRLETSRSSVRGRQLKS
jgi:N-acetylglutamate synthase-like GNAT family acetyltransferase